MRYQKRKDTKKCKRIKIITLIINFDSCRNIFHITNSLIRDRRERKYAVSCSLIKKFYYIYALPVIQLI